MKKRRISFIAFLIMAVVFLSAARAAEDLSAPQITESQPSIVKIEKLDNTFQLTVNGKPYFIKGAGGSAHMDQLVKAGGNSIRTWGSSQNALDKAHEKGLTVCMGLSMRKPRYGDDYTDQTMLVEQRERIADQVRQLKDHPALLMWGLGNEVEHTANHEDAIRVWKEIEILAQMIKKIDSNHPVITVIAGADPKLSDIKRLCPSLDAVGINSYGALAYVPDEIREYNWQKPYLITEFGPRGWWESPQTAWGLPIEQTSTEKADFYAKAYNASIANKPNCLGSYVFLWGNKQEKTHTWFNLFLPDGTPTEIVDTMSCLWTGKWPENRAPKIGPQKIFTHEKDAPHIYAPSQEVIFKVQTQDPENDPMTITWDIRKDGSDNPAIGGDRESRIPPIEDAIVSTQTNTAVIRMPAEPGNYRVFVYVKDPSGKAATANLPIRIEQP